MLKSSKIRNSVKIWLAIYPSITIALYLLESQLISLPIYFRTLVLTLILVPWMVYFAIPTVDKFLDKFTKSKSISKSDDNYSEANYQES